MIEVMHLKSNPLTSKLLQRDVTLRLEKVLDNSKADSGGNRDLNFFQYLVEKQLVIQSELILKRTNLGINEEYFLERYKKMSHESDRHFLCRTIIQDELRKLGLDTMDGMGMGNMDILHANSNYDIVTSDFKNIIDVGLTPARNYFRGLTDLRVDNYLITSYFDDYMDDIIFSVFTRANDEDFNAAVKDYEEGFKQYVPNAAPPPEENVRLYE